MRITFVLPDAGIAGGVRVVAIYAARLQAKGHQVTVMCLPPRPLSLREHLRCFLKGKGWTPKQPSHFDGTSIDLRRLDQWRPMTAADVPDADVVIATWWETAEWVAQFPASKGTKVYLIQHDEALFAGQPVERVRQTWRLPMYKIVVAQWLSDLAAQQFDEPAVPVIPNSVDGNQFFAPPRGKQTQPTVGMMYSDTWWKGSDIGLQAFALAAQQIPNLRLVVFGLTPIAAHLPLPPDTQYFYQPPQSLIKDLYAQCDAWLFTSRVEGFGLPILEAMACRTPVIGTPVGAAPELLKSGGGILVEPEDPIAMAQAIERIHALSELEWQAMSQVAYRQATSYTWEEATQKFEAALHEAIDRVRPCVVPSVAPM
ncbi:MAG: glycosyltransferase family 4 protein [Elainella sp. Prado103]|jgi:glycosyltransferase involved in cell wall biosynthesis|nr:glycosyltransferase family 4 protein [Elainella sp. Prado103]